MRRSWSAAAEDKLRALYATESLSRLAFLLKRTPAAVKSRAGVLGLRRTDRKPWTRKEDALLRKRYATEQTADLARELGRPAGSVFQRANKLGLAKDAATIAECTRKRWRDGRHENSRAACFKPGQEPPNKGVRGRKGWAPGRMAEGQFRKGERRGVAVKLYKPVGTERVSKDGYREVKIHDGLPLQSRWRAVHLVEWEKVNGRIPKGHALVFVNGNKADIRLDNLQLLTRRELMLRNTLHRYPQPIPHLIQLRAAVNRKINRRTRDEEQNVRSA